ncbi:MAG: HEAT repeat domain-containing protein [Planctomycetota bacterium]|jgi:hypothetical protein
MKGWKMILLLLGTAFGLAASRGIAQETAPAPKPRKIVSDATWKVSRVEEPGWKRLDFDDAHWPKAVTEYPNPPDHPQAHYAPFNAFGIETSARWMWYPDGAGNPVFFRKIITLAGAPDRAELLAEGDDRVEIYINGVFVGRAGTDSGYWGRRGCAHAFPVKPFLVPGKNIIACKAEDDMICVGALMELRLNAEPLMKSIEDLPAKHLPEGVETAHPACFSFVLWKAENVKNATVQRSPRTQNAVLYLWNAQNLIRKERPPIVDLLLRNLDRPDPEAVQETIASLGWLNVPEALPSLLDLFRGEQGERTLLLLIDVLGRWGNASHVPLLRQRLDAMRIPERIDVKDLIRQLGAESHAERERATTRLKDLGERAVPDLEAALKSPDLEVQVRARLILDHILSDEKPLMRRLLKNALTQAIQAMQAKGK